MKVSVDIKLGYELTIRWAALKWSRKQCGRDGRRWRLACYHRKSKPDTEKCPGGLGWGDGGPQRIWPQCNKKTQTGPVLRIMLLRACLDLCLLKTTCPLLPVTLLWAALPGRSVRLSLRATCNLVFTFRFAEATAQKKKWFGDANLLISEHWLLNVRL